jgi:hypothetical protein
MDPVLDGAFGATDALGGFIGCDQSLGRREA